MSLDKARVLVVAEELQGTCKSLSDFATEDEQNDVEFCKELDDHVFCCDSCGWWCEIGEQSEAEEALICDDCFEGEE